MRLFRRKPILDADTAEWHLGNFAWLVESFHNRRDFAQTRLILPGPGFFLTDGETGHALAERLFEQVKTYCGFAQSNLTLVPNDGAPQQADAPVFGGVVHGKHAIGTYGAGDGNMAEISYAPNLLVDPLALIATYAHELGHHLLAGGTLHPSPADDDEIEPLTDLTAVYLGFGVFLANSAFSFGQFNDGMMQGWRTARHGYLPERDLVFATAIFLAVRQLDPAPAIQYLKPHLGDLLRKALRDLDDHEDRIAVIRASGNLSQM
jgi:hypothetical protein